MYIFHFYCIAPSGPIQNLNATVTSHEEVFISWMEPNNEDQNGIITGYVINVTRSDTGVIIQRTSTTTNLYLDILEPFTTYACQVASMTVAGLGPFSISVSFLTDQTRKSMIFFIVYLQQLLQESSY